MSEPNIELQNRLIEIIKNNELLMSVFESVKSLELDQFYIGAGCIVQSVWNELYNFPRNHGIDDIDIVYYDNTDLSFDAEDKLIQAGSLLFASLPIKVDIKNQARVHIWYEERFGIKLKPYQTLEEAIESWPTTATSLGVRLEKNGIWRIYAPFGLEDLFSLTVRANKRLITEEIYLNKVNKWLKRWPGLKVIEWNE